MNLLFTRALGAVFCLIVCAAPWAVAHAQNWDDNGGSERLGRLEDEVQALSARIGNGGGGAGGQVTGAAAQQFDMRLQQLEAQMRTLTGQAERTQYQTAQLQNRLERMAQDLEIRFNEIAQRQAQMQQAAQQQAAAAPVVLTPPAETAEEAAEPAAAAPAAEGKTQAGAQALYDDGFAKLRAADYAGAEKMFKQFMAAHGTHALAGNANYWLGETYYVRGQFKEAAVTFAEGYQKYPKNSKAADNLLKLAMSLSSLGSKDDACLTLGELKTKYPNAAPTIRTRADAERKKLGCKG